MEKVTASKLKEMKQKGEKISVLTAYDYGTSKLLNEAEIDVLLVGNSLGMVKLGYENTLPVTVEDIFYHCKAVKRGNSRALLVADMPFMSYEANKKDAVYNAGRLVKEGGAEAVKIEGGLEYFDTIKSIIKTKIPVMGHLGLTPQSINQIGGFKVQGRDEKIAEKILNEAIELEKLGAFAIVLECIPDKLSEQISKALTIPTIGIGAGIHCDGQVLVTDDMLGLFSDFKPKFVKRYANLKSEIINAVKTYRSEVKEGKFPQEENTYK